MTVSKPSGSVFVVKLAVPAVTGTVAKTVVPCENVTVPVATPAVALATVAVKVTGWPAVTGVPEAASVVVVAAVPRVALTVSVVVPELAANVASPLKVAVTTLVATGRLAVTSLAWPLTTWTVPRTVAPLVKVTVPDGLPAVALATVAVRVICSWPNVAGLGVAVTLVVVAAVPAAAVTVTLVVPALVA